MSSSGFVPYQVTRKGSFSAFDENDPFVISERNIMSGDKTMARDLLTEESGPGNKFEEIKHLDQDNAEYWLARELCPVLGYSRWESFSLPIEKAKEACQKSGNPVDNHFRNLTKIVKLGRGGERAISDIALSRFACYLIVQNGDSSKPVIALGQAYFAVQTRRQEVQDADKDFSTLTDDEKRLFLRNELKSHNKNLADAAHNVGVVDPRDYAIFQNHGYKGLYGGLDAQGIHERKGLKKSQKILDYMGHTELAANLFRATQTEEKLRNEHITGKEHANKTHFVVGQAVRRTIRELGGTMPEDLPTPSKSIQQIEKERLKALKNK